MNWKALFTPQVKAAIIALAIAIAAAIVEALTGILLPGSV